MNRDLRPVLIMILIIIPLITEAQRKTRFLRGAINKPGYNNIYPFLSGDGSTMVFMNDYTEDRSYQIKLSRRDAGGKWLAPDDMVLSTAKTIMQGAYCLSFDGTLLIYASRGGAGVGGYDLWWSAFDGANWSTPRNFGAPLNSSENETFPCLSTDGNELYFTRCTIVSGNNVQDCKIMVSKRKRGRIIGWNEPVALTSVINSGNTLMPRFFPDNKTMYFLSSKSTDAPMKWYYTKKETEAWRNPEEIAFLNELEGKLYVGMYYRSGLLITAQKNERDKFNFAETPIPEKFRPDKVVIKTGFVLNSDEEPLNSEIRVRNFETGEMVATSRPDAEDGAYTVIIPEGGVYDFSVNARGGPEIYFSELLDLTALRTSRQTKADYTLFSIANETILPLNVLKYYENSPEVDERSGPEIKRLTRLLKRNEDFIFEIAAYQDSVLMDTIPHPGLTEIIADTIIRYEIVLTLDSARYAASLQPDDTTRIEDTTHVADSVQLANSAQLADSIQATLSRLKPIETDSILKVWNDSLAIVRNDTLLARIFLASLAARVDSIEYIEIKYTYHNDLTIKRAEALAKILVENGIDKNRIITAGYGDKKRPVSVFDTEQLKTGLVEIRFFR